MSGKTYIGTKAKALEVSPKFAAYSKVVLVVTEDLEYTAGTDIGRTLTIECPWGTQQMANDILSKVQGFEYQPYSVDSALLDPAAEIGDGVRVKDTYSGLYSMETNFGNLFVSRVSAPSEEEIDHEFPYTESRDRKITRKLNTFSAELRIQADQISARVEQTGGNPSSFGWELLSNSWSLKSSNTEVFKATKDGISVKGHVVATSGEIGGCSIVGGKLQVPTANITGNLTANSLTVKDAQNKVLLSAGNNAVSIGGWKVDENSLYTTYSDSASRVFICTGTLSQYTIGGYTKKWYIGIGSSTGPGFGVATDGTMCASGGSFTGDVRASSGYFGIWNIGTATLNDRTFDAIYTQGDTGTVYLSANGIYHQDRNTGNVKYKPWTSLVIT